MSAGRKQIPDVCIIGAGLAGALMAYELARRGLKVVVLEAGLRYRLEDRVAAMHERVSGRVQGPAWQSDFPERDVFSSAGTVAYPVNWLRAKGVGGSTLHWGGQSLRFLESDFRLKTLYGIADDWPISYHELEPYYAAAEHALGVAGVADSPFASRRSSGYPLPPFPYSVSDKIFVDACRTLDIVVHHIPWARNSVPYQNRPACAGFATCSGSYRICPISAQYTAETHVKLAEATGNVKVITDAQVVRLITDKRKRVTGAVHVNRKRRETEQKAKLFVLAAHTVESTRLLLLSESSAFPEGLANGSRMVGKNFMERPVIAVSGTLTQPVYPHRIGFPTAASQQYCNPKDRGRRGAIKLEFHNYQGQTPLEIAASSGKWGKPLADEIKQSYGHGISVEAAVEQLPDPRNTISLDPKLRDYFGNPAPRITYTFNAYERDAMDRAVVLGRNILTAANVTSLEGGFDQGFGGHLMGTCRMGDNPTTSVVDRHLRAHEVPNLYIVGGSVFVTGSSLQPSLTIAALAIRAAEHIAATPP